MHSLNNLIIEFYDKLSSWEQSVVKDTGYSLAQVHTIEVLGSHGPMRMKELADRLGITTGTLTVQIEKLVNLGLVNRAAHEDDRRSILVGLTSEGTKLHAHHNRMHIELTKDITRNLDQHSIDVLKTCFEKMNREF
ncbi:MarR family winged helix-turn-helix transcriptional regulator [Shewanella ulleungensis]|jgi:DNA-binding MarR family transcriptional regulator|uniref:Transcriptional regulator n=1 Tax=Shewanella ulleungensis TaxID=2282699 RepID=A0ABQ2QSZ4_9GAMM|nr:MarR family transcriptional regulator [Shewanella ulleungensis]MCL1150669.1 MarR family transcriptional regulator [Shewanella ulleungensis]GGP94521.1 transcriptional regulator [Shewanella ulleungensis]